MDNTDRLNQAMQIANEVGFRNRDRYTTLSLAEEMRAEYFGITEVADAEMQRNLRMQMFRNMTPTQAFMHRLLDAYKSGSKDGLISEEALGVFRTIPPDVDSVNAALCLIAAEYNFRIVKAPITQLTKASTKAERDAFAKNSSNFNKWKNEALEWLVGYLSDERKTTEDSRITMYDVVRYYRYLAVNNFPSIYKLKKAFPIKLDVTNSSEEDYKCPDEDFYSFTVLNNALTIQTDKEVKIFVDDVELKVPLYEYDTEETILMRVSAILKVPYKWIKVVKKINRSQTTTTKTIANVEVNFVDDAKWVFNPLENTEFYLTTALKQIQLMNDVSNFVDALNSIEEDKLILSHEEYLLAYLIYTLDQLGVDTSSSTSIDEAVYELRHPKYDDFFNFVYQSIKLKVMPREKPTYEMIESEREEFEQQFKDKVDSMINIFYTNTTSLNEQQIKLQSIYLSNKNEGDIKISPVKQLDYTIVGAFNLQSIDIYEIFNNLIVDINIPFAKVGKFIKASNNLHLPEEWSASEEDVDEVLQFHISIVEFPQVVNGKILDTNQFLKIVIKEENVKGDMHSFSLRFETSFEEKEEVIISKILTSIKPKPKTINLQRLFSTGLCVIENLVLSPQIFHDFALNNNIIKDTIRLNEKNVVYREKRGLKFKITLASDTNNFISASLNLRVVETNGDPEALFFNVLKGSQVWSLKINGNISTIEVDRLVQKFKIALNLMQKYTTKWTYDYYCRFFKNIKPFLKDTKVSAKAKLSKIGSEIYVANYNRRCSEKPNTYLYASTKDKEEQYQRDDEAFLTPKEVTDRFTNKKIDYMIYPKGAGRQYILTCEGQKTSLVGLIENTTLTNKENFPWIPCCYYTRATSREVYDAGNFNTMNEFKEIMDTKKTTEAKSLITTNKILGENSFGTLTKRLDRLLMLTDDDALIGKYDYLRMGVPNITKNQNWRVISALCYATDKEYNNTLKQQIIDLANSGFLQACNLTREDAMKVLNNEEYMDPRAWQPLLRLVFGVEIILLCQDKVLNTEGTLCPPYYTNFRLVNLKQKKYNQTVFLYVHKGGEFDDVNDPFTELVVRIKADETVAKKKQQTLITSKQLQTMVTNKTFPTNTEQVKNLFDMMDKLYPTKFIEWDGNITVGTQLYDSYGKTRCFVDQNDVTVFCDPMINLIDMNKQTTFTKSSFEQAFNAIEKRDTVPKPVVYKNTVIGLYGLAGNVGTYVPLKSKSQIPYDPSFGEIYDSRLYSYPIPISKAKENFSDKYERYLKVANYLKCNMFYLFSTLFANPSYFNIAEFFNNHVAFEESENASYVLHRELSLNINPFKKINGRVSLVIKAKDRNNYIVILKKLRFILQHALEFSFDYLVEFKTRKFIPNYYISANEFKQNPSWTVYNDLRSFYLMRKGKETDYNVYAGLYENEESFFVQVNFRGAKVIRLAVPIEGIYEDVNEGVKTALSCCLMYEVDRSVYFYDIVDNIEERVDYAVFNQELDMIYETDSQADSLYMIGVMGNRVYALVDYMMFV
jgi:hypothetical protein